MYILKLRHNRDQPFLFLHPVFLFPPFVYNRKVVYHFSFSADEDVGNQGTSLVMKEGAAIILGGGGGGVDIYIDNR